MRYQWRYWMQPCTKPPMRAAYEESARYAKSISGKLCILWSQKKGKIIIKRYSNIILIFILLVVIATISRFFILCDSTSCRVMISTHDRWNPNNNDRMLTVRQGSMNTNILGDLKVVTLSSAGHAPSGQLSPPFPPWNVDDGIWLAKVSSTLVS